MGREFNTDEDSHTIMLYKRQIERGRGYGGFVCVDIGRLSELYEEECKLKVELTMAVMGIPVAQ